MKYLHACRGALGGYLPARSARGAARSAPTLSAFARFMEAAHEREESTPMVFVQILSHLLCDPVLGPTLVPIVADEGRQS